MQKNILRSLFTKTVVIGACSNFLLNMLLIPMFGGLGAAIASVVAESLIAIIQLLYVRKELSGKTVLKVGKNYIFSGAAMLIVLEIESHILPSLIINTVIMVLSGAIVYFVVLIVMKDEFLIRYTKPIIDKYIHR